MASLGTTSASCLGEIGALSVNTSRDRRPLLVLSFLNQRSRKEKRLQSRTPYKGIYHCQEERSSLDSSFADCQGKQLSHMFLQRAMPVRLPRRSRNGHYLSDANKPLPDRTPRHSGQALLTAWSRENLPVQAFYAGHRTWNRKMQALMIRLIHIDTLT